MIKIFRQYNKQLLAIFGSLLLVIWLAGDALNSFLRPDIRKEVRASTKLGNIDQEAIDDAENTTRILALINMNWSRPHLMAPGQLEVTDWLLLEREATQLGTVVTGQAARSMLARSGFNDAVISQIAVRNNISEDAIYRAAARHFTVTEAMSNMLATAAPSEAEIQAAARDEMEKAAIRTVVLKAATFNDAAAEFPESEIEAQFEQFKDKPAGQGLNFGYQIPPQVRMEYLKIDVKKIAGSMAIGEQTLETRAKKFWSENKESEIFLQPEAPKEEPAAEGEAKPEEPAAEGEAKDTPETPAGPKYFEKFADARPAAIEAVRNQFAAQSARELAATLIAELMQPWSQSQNDETGYRVAPAGVEAADFSQKLLAGLPSSIRYLDSVSVHRTGLFDSTKTREATDIGVARVSTQEGARGQGFATVAFNVQGIADIPTDSRADRSMYVSVYQPYPIAFEDPSSDSVFVIRPVEAVDAHTPLGINDVRDKVIADLKLKKAFDVARARAADLQAAASTAGLQAAWDQATELQTLSPDSKPTTPAPFAREGFRASGFGTFSMKGMVSGIGMVDDAFMKSVFALAELPADQPRVTTIEITNVREPMVVLAEWIELKPVTKQDYEKTRPQIVQRIARERTQEMVADWLAVDKIRARTGFTISQ